MSKKSQKVKAAVESVKNQSAQPPVTPFAPTPFYQLPATFYLLLSVVCVAFFFNTFYNDYCVDDLMVITGNKFTQQGFSGISDLFTKDFLYGFRGGESNDLASNRWRPLSMVSFAVEQHFFHGNPHVSHLFNVLFFLLTVLLLFYFCNRFLFKNNWLAFFVALLFAIHPIHTEVVANIKSRDEIFCLFFVLITLISLFYFIENKKNGWIILSLFSFFLSLISKENSATFLAGIPLLLYFFTDLKWKKIIINTTYFVGVMAVYAFIRNEISPFTKAAASAELMNNPFLLATDTEKLATKIYLLLVNLKLLFYPHPLSFDYSYNQFPYRNFGDVWVWISLLIYAALGVFALLTFRKKSIFSFAILLFFITFSISTNLIVEIGTPLGERLLYMPSIAFAIAIAFLFYELLKRIKMLNPIAILILVAPVILLSAKQTISRNSEWKNDNTLNVADIKKCPNAARLCNGAGGAYINFSTDTTISKLKKDSLLFEAIKVLKHGLTIHPTFDDCELNLGVAYSRLDSLELAEYYWNNVRKRAPGHPKFKEYKGYLSISFLNKGLKLGEKHPQEAIVCFEKSAKYDPDNAVTWYNLGGANYTIGNYQAAKDALEKCLKINATYPSAKQGYDACVFKLSQPK